MRCHARTRSSSARRASRSRARRTASRSASARGRLLHRSRASAIRMAMRSRSDVRAVRPGSSSRSHVSWRAVVVVVVFTESSFGAERGAGAKARARRTWRRRRGRPRGCRRRKPWRGPRSGRTRPLRRSANRVRATVLADAERVGRSVTAGDDGWCDRVHHGDLLSTLRAVSNPRPVRTARQEAGREERSDRDCARTARRPGRRRRHPIP